MQIKLTNLHFYLWKAIPKFILKALLLFYCTTVFGFSSSVIFSQNEKVVISSDRTMTIYEVLELIGQQTECTFIYQSDIFKDVPDLTLKKGVIKVITLLKQYLPEAEYDISTTSESYISISRKDVKPLKQRQIEVKGTVTDTTGLPMAGVFITIEGRNKGTSTSIDGSYNILANTDDNLVFSYLGFVSQTIPINGREEINVELVEDVTQLDAVMLNAGYYSVKEKESTGSIVKVEQKDIEQQSLTNPLAAIQGRVAGVEIIQSSGVPGAGFEIKIRGQNSIRTNGNDPLYIIDGVPYSSSSIGSPQTSSVIIPGFGLSPLNNINSADIESIEILKDADATAIYGSRGANGVVLITTKKGKFGKSTLNLTITSGVGNVPNKLDLLSTPEYLEMRREAYSNDGIDPIPFNAYDVNGTWDTNRETDWQKELFGETSLLNSLQASFSGGNEDTQFLISGSYNKQTTVFPGDFNNKQISLLSNLNHKSKNDKLSLQVSTNFSSNNNNLPGISLVREALLLAPNAPRLYNTDGSLNWENSTWNNPLRNLEGKYLAYSTNLITNSTINYNFYKNLRFFINLGYTQSNLKELRTTPSSSFNPAFGLGPEFSSAIHNNGERKSWVVEPQLQWNFKFLNIKVQSLVGMTFQDEKSNQLSQIASGFTSNALIENIGAASQVFVLGDMLSQYRYNALFGRINLNHKDKYLVNFTGRRDGSSRFGSNKKFANFGAIGLAWIFSREDFIENTLPFLSFGKIRTSYGSTGNDQIGDYQYLDTYTFGNNQYQNIVGLNPTRLFNPNFSWEENKKFEVSLELGFFKDRILFNSSYFNNKSSNQLTGIPLPGTTGFNSVNANLDATVANLGWEFQLNTKNIASENFKWSTSINLTFLENKLLKFPDLEGSTFSNQLAIGESLNILKVYESNGVNPQTGLYEFTDFNEDGIISTPEDRKIIKDLNPQYFGGVSNNFVYKNFQLDVLFQFTKQLGLDYLATGNIVGAMSNQPREVLQRWQEEGDETDIQRYTSGLNQNGAIAYTNFAQSDAAVRDASFIRLKTLSLSYMIPKTEKSLLHCELFLRGQNLLTFTNYSGLDPETRNSNTLPPLRFITIGTNLTF